MKAVCNGSSSKLEEYNGDKSEEMGIAIKFHNRLHFERLVVTIPANYIEPIP